MNALVTGGAGFIGSHLVDALVADQHFDKILVIDNYSTGLKKNLEHLEDKIVITHDSVSKPHAVYQMADLFHASQIDVVFHLAAAPGVPFSMKEPALSHMENVNGTFNVLEAARQAKVKRVVFSSSSSIYGGKANFPTYEADFPMIEYRPQSPYAQFKAVGEQYCKMYSSMFGLDTVCLRYFNVMGPRQRADSAYAAVVAAFIDCAVNNKIPKIHGDGLAFRDFTFVDNVVSANILAATYPNLLRGESFNVGTGRKITVNDVHKVSGALPAIYSENRIGDVNGSQASIEKISKVLGYKVLVNFEDGMKLTKEWHLAQKGV